MNISNIYTIIKDLNKLQKYMNKDNENYEYIKSDYDRVLSLIIKRGDNIQDSFDEETDYNSVYIREVLYKIKQLSIEYGFQEDTKFEYNVERLPMKKIIELSKIIAYNISNNFGKFYEKAIVNPHTIINKGRNKMVDGYTMDLTTQIVSNYVVCNVDYTLDSITLLIHEVMHLYNCQYLILDNILLEVFPIYCELVVNEFFLDNKLISKIAYNTNIRNLLSVSELVTIKECSQDQIKLSDELQLIYIYGFILALYLKKMDALEVRKNIDNLTGKLTLTSFLNVVNISEEDFKKLEGIDNELKLMLK